MLYDIPKRKIKNNKSMIEAMNKQFQNRDFQSSKAVKWPSFGNQPVTFVVVFITKTSIRSESYVEILCSTFLWK